MVKIKQVMNPRINSEIQIHKSDGTPDFVGMTAFELRRKYVLFCLSHNQITGAKNLKEARTVAAHPENWCALCEARLQEWTEYKIRTKELKDKRFVHRKKRRNPKNKPNEAIKGKRKNKLSSKNKSLLERLRETNAKHVDRKDKGTPKGRKSTRPLTLVENTDRQ